MKRFSEQLRHAVTSCGQSRYRISQETGISQAALSKFVNGRAWLSEDKTDRVAKYLGLSIITKKKGGK